MQRDSQPLHSRTSRVDITALKHFAAEKLPDCALREILLEDENFQNVDEFLLKTSIYLRLLRRIRV